MIRRNRQAQGYRLQLFQVSILSLAWVLFYGLTAAAAPSAAPADHVVSPPTEANPAAEGPTAPALSLAPTATTEKTDKINETKTEAPVSAPKPANPAKASANANEGFYAQIKNHCARHFPGLIQSNVRAACAAAAKWYFKFERSGAGVNCRLTYGEEPREVMACFVGLEITAASDLGKDDFKKRLQLCAEQYPAHTEIDAILQESCLSGIYMATVLPTKTTFATCAQISPEKSFVGPCGVGLSLAQLAQDLNSPIAPNKQNQICEQYFDHRQFHTGYRACLNGRSAAQEQSSGVREILTNCAAVTSDTDIEKAACFVGASIYRHLVKQDDVETKFKKCGNSKVSYEDRDFLACLTAASLTDYGSRGAAESGCKEIFKAPKNSARQNCVKSLGLF